MQVTSALCSSLLFQLKKNISLVQRPHTKLHQCGRDNSHQRHKQQIYDAQLREKRRRDVCSCCESEKTKVFLEVQREKDLCVCASIVPMLNCDRRDLVSFNDSTRTAGRVELLRESWLTNGKKEK